MDENDSIRLFEEMTGAAGKKRKVPVEMEVLKLWLAQVGRERMGEVSTLNRQSFRSDQVNTGRDQLSTVQKGVVGRLKMSAPPGHINENMYFRLRCHRDNLWICIPKSRTSDGTFA